MVIRNPARGDSIGSNEIEKDKVRVLPRLDWGRGKRGDVI